MNDIQYPDYIEILKLKESHSIYIMAALVLGVDPRLLKQFPNVVNIDGKEVLTYEDTGSIQSWYIPVKAENCTINEYIEQEAENHLQVPIDKLDSLGVYNRSICDVLYQELKQSLISAVQKKHIQCVYPEFVNKDKWIEKPVEGHKVTTESVKKWFQQNNLKTPFFDTPSKTAHLLNSLDKNHAEHSLELGVAIEAWERFSELGISHPKAYIQKWLNEFHGSLDKKAKDRICTLVNWKKQGGAKSQSFKIAIYNQALSKDIRN